MFTLFLHLNKSTCDLLEEVGCNPVVVDSAFEFERPFYIAILTEMEEVDEIKKVFKREMNFRGSEKEAICYFKVI